MAKVVIVRPGKTDFDEQRRIQGVLDLPLSESGANQVRKLATELCGTVWDAVYSGPCKSAQLTAQAIANSKVKVKIEKQFTNLDLGLWNGKLVEDLKHCQPSIYRQWQEEPESVSPPAGETIEMMRSRIAKALSKLLKKHREETIAVVLPEPMATIVACWLAGKEIGNLWKSSDKCGTWEAIEFAAEDLPKRVTV